VRVPAGVVREYLLGVSRRASRRDMDVADAVALQALSLAGPGERVTAKLVSSVAGPPPAETGQRLRRLLDRGYVHDGDGTYRLTDLGWRVVEELERDM